MLRLFCSIFLVTEVFFGVVFFLAPPPKRLRLALIGAREATDLGSNNLLLDNNLEDFSPQLYNLCGRHYSVTDMLDFPNTDSIQLKDGIHAFLLLVPNGLHVKHTFQEFGG